MVKLENPTYIVHSYGRDTIRAIAGVIHDCPDCRYSRYDIATNIFAACLKGRSIDAISKAPIGDTVRKRIGRDETNLSAIDGLIGLQKPKKGSHITILFDGHDVMFYGKRTNGVVGTKSKDGSHYAFKYLAAYTTSEPHLFIGIMPLFDGSMTGPVMSMIENLMDDYIIDVVIADGEFYSAELIEMLSRNRIDFICRRTNTGNIRELNIPYEEPYLYEITVKRDGGREIRLSYQLYRYKGRNGDFYLASSIKTASKRLRKMFKTRWNIETGFREVNGVKAKTTTKDMIVRLFYYVVSCIIYNLWMKTRFRFSLLVIRMYSFAEWLLDFVKDSLLRSKDVGNGARIRPVALKL